MARELGMNPKKLGSLDNHRQEKWKLPLAEFIAECYRKRFGRPAPDVVRSLEQLIDAVEAKKALKRDCKAERAKAVQTGNSAEPVNDGIENDWSIEFDDGLAISAGTDTNNAFDEA